MKSGEREGREVSIAVMPGERDSSWRGVVDAWRSESGEDDDTRKATCVD